VYCLNDVAVPLTASPSLPGYTLYYYTTATGGSPQTSITPSTATAGLTTYYVSEGLGLACISSNRIPLNVIVNKMPVFTTSFTNVTRFGSGNGSIKITVTDGLSPYQFSINNGSSYSSFGVSPYTITGLGPGTYKIRVKDSNGCESAFVSP